MVDTIYTPTSSGGLHKHKCIRIDNIILVLSMYGRVLECVYASYGSIVKAVVEDGIIYECIANLDQHGIGWVVRKL